MNGEHQDVFTTDELRRLWDLGEIAKDALYWHRGPPAWKPVTDFQPPTTDMLRAPLGPMRLSTAPSIANEQIETEIDIITSECALGMNALHDWFAGLTDVVEGRSDTIPKALRHARESCLNELRAEAQRRAADAVIAVDLDYSELSGQ